MSRILKSMLVVVGLLFSFTAVAHPGHGAMSGHELWHYVSSPVHIGVTLIMVVVAIIAYKVFRGLNRPASGK